jgi:arylsulfatase A-like enzyme
MMSAIDDGVGRIIQNLKENDLYQNTLIFFLSDNGAPIKMDYEDKTISYIYGAWDGSYNEPFVGEKGMLSEGGIRVPFIISWPDKLPQGIIYNDPVISLDIAATSLAAAGLNKNNSIDGVNLIPYLTGSEAGPPHNALYWRFWDQSAIRIGKWKFLKAGNREFLFDLGSAVHERNNLISDNPEKAEELKNKLVEWASKMKNPGLYDDEVRREKQWYNFYFPEK